VVEKVIGSGMRGSTFSVMLPEKPDTDGQYRKAEFLTAGGIPTAVLATNPGTYLATNSSRSTPCRSRATAGSRRYRV
jgi:hypothetical protein